jgi:hypothetical protein
MSGGANYTIIENEIILEYMQGTNPRSHDAVVKRAQKISDQYLPHRTAEGIGDHWRYLIGNKNYKWINTSLPEVPRHWLVRGGNGIR